MPGQIVAAGESASLGWFAAPVDRWGDDLAAIEVAGHARQALADARAAATGGGTTGVAPAVDVLAALLNQAGFAPGVATADEAARAAEVSTV